MTAWDLLTANSTLETGAAWEHLQAQGGGGGLTIILANGMSGNVSPVNLTASIVFRPLSASIDNTVISAEIINVIMSSAIEIQTFSGSITSSSLTGEI